MSYACWHHMSLPGYSRLQRATKGITEHQSVAVAGIKAPVMRGDAG